MVKSVDGFLIGVGGIPVFSYFSIFYLNRLNILTLKINTESRIIETSKYRTVINRVTRASECSRILMAEDLVNKTGTKSKAWDDFGL